MTDPAPRFEAKRYVLKEPGALHPGAWIVTARFTVQIKTNVHLPCVRLRYQGAGPVKYFTVDELKRLFNPVLN